MISDTSKIIFSWIGDADFSAWANSCGKNALQAVESNLGKQLRFVEGPGPIKALVDQVEFDEINLLSDKDPTLAKKFAEWIGPKAKIHTVKLKSPVDYASIFESVDSVLGNVIAKMLGKYVLSIHLSPGTPAMTAVWVLLGKSRYPATFYQTYRGEVIPTTIPFDLLVDYIPTVLYASDQLIQNVNIKDAAVEGFGAVIGKSPQIREAIVRARRIAVRDVGVLLLGESGVGKDVFANGLHSVSRRKNNPFVSINCAAVHKELLESELFGHKKGAFTGATEDRIGAFEQANTGTLFLDEVGECDLAMQAKLLRVLQPDLNEASSIRTFTRVGGSTKQKVDVRIIAATNRDLCAEVAAGRFREDLYYRIAAFTLKIPPLRNRTGDIPKIVEYLLLKINSDFSKTEAGYKNKKLSVGALRLLCKQSWPGNVRQLQNVLLQAVVMVDGAVIEARDIEAGLSEVVTINEGGNYDPPLGEGFSLIDYIEDIQRRFLLRAMQEAGGKKTAAAALLGYTNYQSLAAQLHRLKVDWVN